MRYSGLKKYSIGNGEGIRVSLYVSGCQFHCKGCFNQETWDYDYGELYTEDTEKEILELIKSDKVDGLSLLGGDPLWQSYGDMVQLFNLVNKVAMLGKTIWLWSGFTFEELMEDEIEKDDPELWTMRRSLALACNVWVDGRFILSKRDLRLQWCGSTNQRVIDIEATLKKGEVVLYKSKFTK